MGFPSPANDYIEKRIDLNDILMPHRNYMIMIETPDGFVLADKSMKPKPGDKVHFRQANSRSWEDCSGQASLLWTARRSTEKGWRGLSCWGR